MVSLSSFEAKTRFGELLDRVAKGDSVVITRHGRAIARIIPVGKPDGERRRAAIAKLLEFNRGQRLGDVSVRQLIEEGRR